MTDRDDATPGNDPAPQASEATGSADHSIRGWQLLAEKRGQEAEATRAERDALAARLAEIEGSAKARQLAEDYPDAAELFLQQGAEKITPADEPLLAQLQAAIAGREPRIDPNSARRRTPPPAPSTPADLVKQIRDWDGPTW